MTSASTAGPGPGWTTYAAGVAWASIFGLSFLATKGALEAFSPFELLFLRFALATAVLVALVLAKVVELRFRGKPKGRLVLACLFQPVLYFFFETYGVRETATSTAGLLLGALPAAVAALSRVMLKERLSPRRIAGLLLSVAGVCLVVLGAGAGAGEDSPRGIAMIVLALASAAFYNVFSKKSSEVYSPVEVTFAMMASGAAVYGLLALAEALARPGPSLFARATPAAWGAVAYLGILSSVLAFFLVNLTLARLEAYRSAVFGALVTLFSLAAGAAFRGESVGPVKALGAAAILAGIWATNAGDGRRGGGEKV
jgi:drug/metabolite transporter (DMT)-like permease